MAPSLHLQHNKSRTTSTPGSMFSSPTSSPSASSSSSSPSSLSVSNYQHHHSTPIKSPMSSSPNGASPRLRSPRGSPTSPRHATAVLFGVMRHTKSVLLVAAVAAMWFMRPSSLESSSMGGGSIFFDSSSFDFSALVGANHSSLPSSPSSFVISEDGDGDDDDSADDSNDHDDDHEDGDEEDHVSMDARESTIDTKERIQSITSQPEATSTIGVPSVLPPETVRKAMPREDLKLLTRSSTIPHEHSLLLATYEPFRHPLLPLPRNASDPSQLLDVPMPVVDVHLIVDISSGDSVGPPSKFLLDGLERSPYMNLVGMTFLNPSIHRVKIGERGRSKQRRPMVWVIDWGSMLRDCHRLKRALQEHGRTKDEYVFLVDYSGSVRQSKCDAIFDSDDTRVRLAKRSVIIHRHYDIQTKTLHVGQVAMNSVRLASNTTEPVMQASLVARERFVSALMSESRLSNPMKSTRRNDVCLFWQEGDYSHYGFWRRDVTNFIKEFGEKFNYTTLLDVVINDPEGMEEGNIQLKYIKALLSCKIVVVAQRDEWEDHYRLYESLASGALVMTDPMLAPPEGLRNKTNVLVYDTLTTLESLLTFHLQQASRRKSIARRGMELALGRYRSWHRVEQLFFGQPLHAVGRPFEDPPKKKTRPHITLVDGDTALAT